MNPSVAIFPSYDSHLPFTYHNYRIQFHNKHYVDTEYGPVPLVIIARCVQPLGLRVP